MIMQLHGHLIINASSIEVRYDLISQAVCCTMEYVS